MLDYNFYSAEQTSPYGDIEIEVSKISRIFVQVVRLHFDRRELTKRTVDRYEKGMTNFINYVREYADPRELICLRRCIGKWKKHMQDTRGVWRRYKTTYYVLCDICDVLVAIKLEEDLRDKWEYSGAKRIGFRKTRHSGSIRQTKRQTHKRT